MKKTLLVMAAGMGSRYGGLKQMDAVGPHYEYLIDYAVYDAIRAGFDKVVFVIKRTFSSDFKKHFSTHKFNGKIKIAYAYQDLNDLPSGFRLNPDRVKPWGTGHAILAARNFIKEPFAVISADDFYGLSAYQLLSDFFSTLEKNSTNKYAMVGYQLSHTLSPNGWVARGICKVDKKNYLTSIHEHTKVGWLDGKIISRDKHNRDHLLSPNRLVSMIMFGFTPDIFNYLQLSFNNFLKDYQEDLNREFFTPNVVNELVQNKQVTMKVLPTNSHWFGMTYLLDKEQTMKEIKQLISNGVYPENLWSAPVKK